MSCNLSWTECLNGFYGDNCASECPCIHFESCDHVSGACTCSAGWEGAHCDVDVDECEDNEHTCTADHDMCVNTEGSFRCACEVGYLKDYRNSCVGKYCFCNNLH